MFLMIDNYDSFTYNLYALFRECNVQVKVIKNDEYIPADDYHGIIISPGPSSPKNSGTSMRYLREYTGKKPIFGVCLGMQCIAESMGNDIVHAETIRHGKVDSITVTNDSVLFKNLPDKFKVVRYHSLAADIDESLVTSRAINDNVVMSIEDREKQLFGLQFHPESILSEYGREIVNNFLDFTGYGEKKMKGLVSKINSGSTLDFNESVDFFEGMVNGSMSEAQIGSTLISMKNRGESVDELAGLVSVLNRHKVKFSHDAEKCIDTCGTGGDGKSTVNVSTAVSIILASLGYNIVKHGNTAQSGKVGSADILKSAGLDIEYTGTSAGDFFSENNFVFLFAQRHHPALKNIGKVRREIMSPTIFNFVGPLVNPADPDYQIIGISRKDKLDFIAESIKRLGRNNITVYSSNDGYDEVSSSDKTECITISNNRLERFEIDPSDFFEPFQMPEVKDGEDALQLFFDGMSGDNENVMKIFSINTALALHTIEGKDMKEGYELVMEQLKSGRVKEKMDSMFGK